MYEIVTYEKRYIDQTEPDIIVSFQIPRSVWNILRRSKFWKEVEKFLKHGQSGTHTF